MNITILHGSDGKWHLFDTEKNHAIDWPPCDTKLQAQAERRHMLRDLQGLAGDELSETIIGGQS